MHSPRYHIIITLIISLSNWTNVILGASDYWLETRMGVGEPQVPRRSTWVCYSVLHLHASCWVPQFTSGFCSQTHFHPSSSLDVSDRASPARTVHESPSTALQHQLMLRGRIIQISFLNYTVVRYRYTRRWGGCPHGNSCYRMLRQHTFSCSADIQMSFLDLKLANRFHFRFQEKNSNLNRESNLNCKFFKAQKLWLNLNYESLFSLNI